jgi:hypothetical protein
VVFLCLELADWTPLLQPLWLENHNAQTNKQTNKKQVINAERIPIPQREVPFVLAHRLSVGRREMEKNVPDAIEVGTEQQTMVLSGLATQHKLCLKRGKQGVNAR